jgi:hypothetical protein
MYNVFDRTTNRFLYNEYQFGTLQRVDLVTNETKSIQDDKRELRWNWCAPVIVSRHDSNVLYHGSNILLKSTYRGETWQEISPDLTTNDPKKLASGKGGDGNIQFCTITALAESPLVPGLLWVGTDDGNVWVTRDDGKSWTKLNDKITGNPGTWVSRVEASNADPGTAYVSYTGFRNDDFRPFLYKTTDYGQTWTSLAANLPNESINVIREHPQSPDLLFCGTDAGLYVSLDGGQAWTRMKNNMPTQPVHDLVIQSRENDLVVATHGRGIFIADLTPLRSITASVLAEDVHLFPVKPRVRWISERESHASSSNFQGESEQTGMAVYYYLKGPAKDVKLQVFRGRLMINEVKASNSSGLNKVLWNMTFRKERTAEEKKQFQERMKRYAEFARFMGDIDPNYEFFPAGEGDYRLVLKVDGREWSVDGTILADVWHQR